MKSLSIVILLVCSLGVSSQELYVYSEPASNMPAHSISTKLSANFITKQSSGDRFMQRYTPELMFGINKNWMVHVGASFADMHTRNFRWESVYVYG